MLKITSLWDVASELEEIEFRLQNGISTLLVLWSAAEYGRLSEKDLASALWYLCHTLSDDENRLRVLTEAALAASKEGAV